MLTICVCVSDYRKVQWGKKTIPRHMERSLVVESPNKISVVCLQIYLRILFAKVWHTIVNRFSWVTGHWQRVKHIIAKIIAHFSGLTTYGKRLSKRRLRLAIKNYANYTVTVVWTSVYRFLRASMTHSFLTYPHTRPWPSCFLTGSACWIPRCGWRRVSDSLNLYMGFMIAHSEK